MIHQRHLEPDVDGLFGIIALSVVSAIIIRVLWRELLNLLMILFVAVVFAGVLSLSLGLQLLTERG